jgi:hypothetical protein
MIAWARGLLPRVSHVKCSLNGKRFLSNSKTGGSQGRIFNRHMPGRCCHGLQTLFFFEPDRKNSAGFYFHLLIAIIEIIV